MCIRDRLSTSHLYSSAFVVDKAELSAEGIPGRFILTGAGWGHGVGPVSYTHLVSYQGDYKTFVLGFPFESIRTDSEREALMNAVLTFFNDNKYYLSLIHICSSHFLP